MNHDPRLDGVIKEFNSLPGIEVYEVYSEENELDFRIRFTIDENADGCFGSLEVITDFSVEQEGNLECFWVNDEEDGDSYMGFEFCGSNYEEAHEGLARIWLKHIQIWEDKNTDEVTPLCLRVCALSLEDALYLLDTFGREWLEEVHAFYKKAENNELKPSEQLPMARNIAWEMENGKRIPTGYWLRHDCETRQCIRPDHAVLVSVNS